MVVGLTKSFVERVVVCFRETGNYVKHCGTSTFDSYSIRVSVLRK